MALIFLFLQIILNVNFALMTTTTRTANYYENNSRDNNNINKPMQQNVSNSSFNYKDNVDSLVSFKENNLIKFVIDPQSIDDDVALRLNEIKQQQRRRRGRQTELLPNSNEFFADEERHVQTLHSNSNPNSNDDEIESTNEICMYSSIRSKLSECFQSSNNCNVILECIASLNLVEVCQHYNMMTPTVWIVNIYEILHEKGFCQISLGCPSVANEYLNENGYLIKLVNLLKTINDYGPAYLNQPKVDNKMYCSKSHNLVSNVRDLFDGLDQCLNATAMEDILNAIDDSSENILDRNCLYCISANSFFEDCEMNNYGNDFSCNSSLKCIYDKIDFYKCNKDKDITPLTLISSFMTNVSSVCELETNETESSLLIIEWFKSMNGCIRDKRFLGLTYIEAPPNVDICLEMDEAFKCMHRTLHDFEIIKQKVKHQFALFADRYIRMQRTCDILSLTTTTVAPFNAITRHPFQNNSEQTVLEDNKSYYHETIVRAELDQLINWINIDSNRFSDFHVKKDEDLSKNYLKATIVKLRFKFPYYGHLLDQIVVATGGFIYVGSLMNPLITKAQYIAPLMANFDPTLNNRTIIKYVDNGTHFICTWENLLLQDQPENGEYTFQVVLNNNGDIKFNYKKIPTTKISNINHTVKIGLSDAYIYYKILSTSKIEYTIVQYHVANVQLENVKTGNSIMFFMLKNCLQLKTCDACLDGVGNFRCLWCPILQRCSDTMDRYRQEWIESSCPMDPTTQSANSTCAPLILVNDQIISSSTDAKLPDQDYIKSVSIGIFLTILVAMVLTIFAWAIYAYKNPTSPSGIWLIEHRPTRVFSIFANSFKRESSNSNRFTNPVA